MSTDRSRRVLLDDDASALSTHDACAVLGVGPDATVRELRRAYRRALLAAHPDQGGSREALDLVRGAYQQLRTTARPDASADASASVDASASIDASASVDPVPVPTAAPTSPAPEPVVDVAQFDLDPIASAADAGPGPVRSTPAAPPAPPAPPTMNAAGARAAARFVTAQRFASMAEPNPSSRPRRRVGARARGRFEELLERELIRRSDRQVRLVGAPDHAGARP